ncbi:TIGR04282 family arsenosugar biosynthesis glycosyltransferase [Actinomadura sp. 6N118]|uniref:TIGR04282 family arsenosugar biosynthesis glycosyltransferase n=1 Tax=Actinomadura sp. 6N118 TaxID=3375151 RepID=UPI00379EFFC3
MNAAQVTFLVIAKEPVPGRVKTRLTPAYTSEEAAELAEASLADTLTTVAAVPAADRVLALAGKPGEWLPPGFRVIPQRGGGLDERLAAAFDDAWTGHPLVLIGMDTPQVSPTLLKQAAQLLRTHDAVFGPAADGGFWLLGLSRPDAGLLHGVPMSRSNTGRVQLDRLRAADLSVASLPVLTDVDTAADAEAVATATPDGRFAAAVRRMREGRAVRT